MMLTSITQRWKMAVRLSVDQSHSSARFVARVLAGNGMSLSTLKWYTKVGNGFSFSSELISEVTQHKPSKCCCSFKALLELQVSTNLTLCYCSFGLHISAHFTLCYCRCRSPCSWGWWRCQLYRSWRRSAEYGLWSGYTRHIYNWRRVWEQLSNSLTEPNEIQGIAGHHPQG